jgi:class 3 adenylate cyclase
MKPPPVEFAPSPGGHIAYQVLGDGPIDLLFHAGPRNLEIIWENPALERFLRRLASFSRLFLVNYRGMGLSDPIPFGAPPTQEEWASDWLWVMDAAGSERAAMMAAGEGGGSLPLFAATHPERTQALALVDCFATLRRSDDYPWGFPDESLEHFMKMFAEQYGTGANLRVTAPELVDDERFREWFARLERLSMSRATATLSGRVMTSWDTRGILSSIKAPTLVISHAGNNWIRPEHGRYLAEHIPNARYVERPGFWGLFWIHDVDWVLDEVETFLTGAKSVPSLDDRVLATVLFTDIVGSTELASAMGDQRWHWLLDEHDTIMAREIERYRGRTVKSTGDGYLATFDGPARAIRCAHAINEAVAPLGIQLRAGLHTGEIELRGEDVGGIAVHIAARVMSEAGPGEVLVSGAVPPLLAGSGIEFDDRGIRMLKGVLGEWRLYAATD